MLVIGGGVGLAPLRALLYHLFANLEAYERVSIKYGVARAPRSCASAASTRSGRRSPRVDFTAHHRPPGRRVGRARWGW